MSSGSFAEYLSSLDEASLTALLRVRPDVRIEPVPRGFPQLAQRLSGVDSLSAALRTVNRDAVVVGQVIAALGATGTPATAHAAARLLDAPERAVLDGIAELCRQGLAWTDASGAVYLPEQLAAHWSAEIGGGRPVAVIARQTVVESLRSTAATLGIDTDGLRKPELVARVCETMADLRAMASVLARLPQPAMSRLRAMRGGYYGSYYGYNERRNGAEDPTKELLEAGLVVPGMHGQPELPKEIALAAWLSERELTLTGPPDIAMAGTDADAADTAAQAAAREALRGLTALLDEARAKPIAALKKGGVGPRERTRLAARLSIPGDTLLLWIDLAYAAGLLGEVDAGYAPTNSYKDWRRAEPSRQWATLAKAWFELAHAPLNREIQGDKEHPPPLPLASAAGTIRQATLLAARAGRSVSVAGAQVGWFFPLHGYELRQLDDKVTAAIQEAQLLGVVATDRVTTLGEHLLAVADPAAEAVPGAVISTDADLVHELAQRCATLLPNDTCSVILQSDLTAVVSGQPSVAVSELLRAAAVSEARGSAAVWRFTPASIRAALDSGWTARDLLAELKTMSNRAVPQPLEYLINDAARRHGQVRVRGVRSCVLAGEAMATEILHTRSLAKLHLSQLSPTVLASPYELDKVLAQLRAAGLSPVAEDAAGTVIVETRREHRADDLEQMPATRPRSWRGAADLAKQLKGDPDGAGGSGAGGSARQVANSDTVAELALQLARGQRG